MDMEGTISIRDENILITNLSLLSLPLR